jgi:hypothetical protein
MGIATDGKLCEITDGEQLAVLVHPKAFPGARNKVAFELLLALHLARQLLHRHHCRHLLMLPAGYST